jgi:hypothetical protein
MAAYKDLVGQKITKVTSNPGEPKTGQMWYNSTDGKLRGLGILEAWSSSGPLINARRSVRGAGTTSAGLAVGGCAGDGTSVTAATEEYSGSGWATGGSLNTARFSGACAVNAPQTAALYGLGSTGTVTNVTEEYDGTSWTTTNTASQSRFSVTGFGIQTAAVAAGGNPGPDYVTSVEHYDGSSWTGGTALPAKRAYLGGFGLQTAGVVAGGSTQSPATPNATATAFEYDGSSWTATPNMPATGIVFGTAGIQTDGLVFAGNTASVNKAYSYNGTTFAEAANLANSDFTRAGAGSGTSAFAAGGDNPGAPNSGVSSTEEFNKSTNTITAGAWASAANYPAAGYGGAGCGTSTAGLGFTGQPTAWNTLTCKFDGSSWTTSGAFPVGRRYMAGLGTQTAALASQGAAIGGSASNTAYEFDGSSWSSANSANTSKSFMQGFGIQTAGTTCGGDAGSAQDTSENYDGTNWTVSGTMNTARALGACAGTQTAGIMYGGNNPPPGSSASETYDGSSWTTGPSLNRGVFGLGGTGATNSAALGMGGYTSPPTQITGTELYNGTAWITQPNMATARGYNQVSFGISTSAVTVGDFPAANTVEIFTGETETANVTDFTTS